MIIKDSNASWFGYKNFSECLADKQEEYIEKADLLYEDYMMAAYRKAFMYCDEKFPFLQPVYERIDNVEGTWGYLGKVTFLGDKNDYRIHLNKPCDKVSFIVKTKDGYTKEFKDQPVHIAETALLSLLI